MTKINLLTNLEPGSWSRLFARAKRSRSMTRDARASALYGAVLDMREEQRTEGLKAGFVLCEEPRCCNVATHHWVRSAADLKAMRRKVKRSWVEGVPEMIHCERHITSWDRPKYVPLAELRVAA